MPKSEFWVYENKPVPHACIHYYKCNRCNDGDGVKRLGKTSKKKTGIWTPYPSYKKANTYIPTSPKAGPVRDCTYCNRKGWLK